MNEKESPKVVVNGNFSPKLHFLGKYIELINKDFPLGKKLLILDASIIQAIETIQDPDSTYTTVYLSTGEKFITTLPYDRLLEKINRMLADKRYKFR